MMEAHQPVVVEELAAAVLAIVTVALSPEEG